MDSYWRCSRTMGKQDRDDVMINVLVSHILLQFTWPKGRPAPAPTQEGSFSLSNVLFFMVNPIPSLYSFLGNSEFA